MSEKISLVVPCYNEEEVLPYFYEEFCKVAEKLSEFQLEVIFVDDGSKDRTLAIVKELAEKDTRVKYLSFPEILERKLLSMPDFSMQTEIMWQCWMRICRTRPRCCRKCFAVSGKKAMIR